MSGDGGPNRTVFRPSPLQAKAGGAPAAAAPAAQPSGGFSGFGPSPLQGQAQAQVQQVPAGAYVPPRPVNDDVPEPPVARAPRNPMMEAASSFLALTASVRAGRARLPLPELHGKASAMIEGFRAAVKGRYPDEHIMRATYALCATIDDVAQNLPDQAADAAMWAQRNMIVRFFGENIGGDRFWRLLDEMIASPAQNPDVLELYHACLASGFEGRYRIGPDGKRQHQELMQRAYLALQHPKRLSQTELSPRWKGEDAPLGKVGLWTPLIFAAAGALALLVVIYLVMRLVLAQTGGPALAALDAVNPNQPLRLSRVAPTSVPDASAQSERIRTFLAPEVAQGLVTVVEDASTVRVRTTVGQLFRSGSDQLDPQREPLIRRIGQAMETEPGPIKIEGYTDSDRLSGLTFPDNYALSQARADTAAGIIRSTLSDPARATAEGYGDEQAIAGNDTAEGKARNRRVEFVVQRRG